MNTTEHMNLKDFLSIYANEIKSKVQDTLTPLYQADKHDSWDIAQEKKLAALLRKPFQAQTNTILAIAKSLYQQDKKSAILCGEMGSGKSLLSIGIASIIGKTDSRIIVICPPHLVSKWVREIRMTDAMATDIRVLKTIKDVNLTLPLGREYWIISKERAKLHYQEKKSTLKSRNGEAVCPDCGCVIEEESVRKCEKCNSVLYSADNSKFRRYALAEYIKRRKKHCRIDLLICDEAHEYKGGSTSQGQAFHCLAVAAKKCIALSGSIMGGFSSNLYHLLFRMFTRKMVAHGYKHNSSSEFSARYGVVEEISEFKETSVKSASLGKEKTMKRVIEKPGISPLLLPHFLLEDSCYLWVSDITDSLPSYTEEVELVEMTDEQKYVYDGFCKELTYEVKRALGRKDNRLLGALVNSLYALPDGARRGESVFEPDTQNVLCHAVPLNIPILPKEEKLIEIILQEKAENCKCAVFLEHTGTRDLIADLSERLQDSGISSLILRSETVDTSKREEWLTRNVAKNDPDVLICNPAVVKTGLDLLEFPTIIYFQTGLSIYTLRQSSRRSWRIGQTKDVRVFFMAYFGTAQESAMKLIAAKMETSHAIEGKLANDGLLKLSEGESSMMFELARSIMGTDTTTRRSMSAIWSSYKQSEPDIKVKATVTPIIIPATTLSGKPIYHQISIFDLLESIDNEHYAEAV